MSTTGGHVWDAVHHFLDFLEIMKEDIGLDQPNVRVVELGAGCGYLGMVIGRNLPNLEELCLTEMVWGNALEHLEYNISINQDRIPIDSVQTRACDWSLFQDTPATDSERPQDYDYLRQTSWDFVIGSELVYNEAGVHMLPNVMAALTSPKTHIYYCHSKHRYDKMDMDFFANLEAAGLCWEEVRAKNVPAPPPSPPPLTELFPRMRFAIFHIWRPSSN
eukprot:c16006_g1_i1.p1 GENE.c16006_g1_i1~~c16006_g1_i1.p1  ORF type:complete len:249 (+),score=29.13 c16006_g1_i1:92-748(+)